MNACPTCREYQADAVYGQLEARAQARFLRHLEEDRTCAAAFEELRAVVAAMRTAEAEQDETPALDSLWTRLEGELVSQKNTRNKRLAWARALMAVAAVFIASLGLWYGLRQEKAPPPAVNPDLASLTRYLDKAQPLLLAVANHREDKSTATGFDHQTERDHAALLAREAEQIRASLTRAGSANRLLGDIEVLLLQIANLDDGQYNKGIAVVQDTMQRRTILLKVSLLEMKQNTT